MPNTVFSGTAMAAAVSDNRTAASASGSLMALKKADTPCAKASLNTSTSGSSSRMAMNAIATAPSSSFSHKGSSVGFLKVRLICVFAAQLCRPFRASSITKLAASITTPIAAAPA